MDTILSFHTVPEDTERCAVCVSRVCESVCILVEVSLSEHLKTRVLLSFSSTSSHWKLSLVPLPSFLRSIWRTLSSSFLSTSSSSSSLFSYWRAWKGWTARGQSSGGSLLNCLLSGGSGFKKKKKSREKVAILVSQNPKMIRKNRGHAFLTFYFSTSAFCVFIPWLRLSYECISLLLFYSEQQPHSSAFFCDLQSEGGCALLAMVTRTEPPLFSKQVLIGMPEYPVLS